MSGPSARGDAAAIRTFLIADIRGYTSFTQTHGDEAAGRLASTFAEVAHDVVPAAGGRVQELRGDEAMCVFASPRQAIRAAVELQRRFVALTIADPELPFGIGIGIDAGEAVRVRGGFRGGALNLAARLCSLAAAGEIFASREAVHLARQIDGIDYVERGAVALKGIDPAPVVVRIVPRPDPAADIAFLQAVRPRAAQEKAARARRRRRALVVGSVAAAVLVADVGVVVARSGALRSLSSIGTNAVGIVDLGQSVLYDRVAVGAGPGALAADKSAVWVANGIDGTVSSIDLQHHAVANTLPVGKDPAGIAIADGTVWVANADDRSVSRIAEQSKTVVGQVAVGNGPTAVAAGAGAVWVANSLDGTVSVIDPTKNAVAATVAVGAAPSAVAVGRAVWVSNSGSATVSRIDPSSRQTVATIPVGNDPSAIVVARGAVWVANSLDGTVSRIDPDTNTVTGTVGVGGEPTALAVAGHTIWVADPLGDRVVRLDADRNRVSKVVALGNAPQAAVVAGGRLWLSARGSGRSHRGGTLRIGIGDNIISLDPALGYTGDSWSLESDIYDGLVTFQHVGGPGGSLIVPDLAVALPSVTNAGLTYSFQLRRGIRFSNGQPLHASDFYRSMRRSLLIGSGAAYYDAIVGAATCRERQQCDRLAQGIVVDDATGSVVLHLVERDPELLYQLSLPFADVVGPGAPMKDNGFRPLVGTGPYVLAPNVPDGKVVLRRNPFFREWSHLARPDGYPDAIDVAVVSGDESAAYVKATANSSDDFVSGIIDPSQLASLRLQHPTQLHPFTQPATRYAFLNPNVPPFSDVRVRRALNFAVDRRVAVQQLGGEFTARATCQVLPPSFYGFRPYCPYTLHPSAAGSWSAPDLATARRLVAESGTHGMKVTVISGTSDSQREVTVPIVAAMRALGYRVTVRVITGNNDGQDYYDYITRRVHRPPAGPGGWQADYPAPSNFIEELLSCEANTATDNQNAGEFCDRGVDAQIQVALQLQTTDPAAAGAAWSALDRRITDEAAWVPLVNDTGWDLVSERIGNYQHHPEWGALFDQFWVQ